jgi:hypothetical protein
MWVYDRANPKEGAMKYLVLLLAMLSGCATMPTPQELASLDYGQPIEQGAAITAVKAHASQSLKDPLSATYDCGPVIRYHAHGGLLTGSKPIGGFAIDCSINAKNSFGGYVGARSYRYLFHDGVIVMSGPIFANGSFVADGSL